MNSTKDAHELQKEKSKPNGGLEGKGSGQSADDPRFCCAFLISNRENPQAPNSKIWTCRSRKVKNSPTSGVMNAKWRVGINIHVSINLNQQHALNTVSWANTSEHEETSSDKMYISDKTSCTGSVDRFMRLKTREDNSNKETLIYIPYISCLLDWAYTTWAVYNNS